MSYYFSFDMGSGIYAVANIGHLKLYVGEASKISRNWPPILAQLNSDSYPNTTLQQVWKVEGEKRRFTFHTKQEILANSEIIGAEKLLES